MRDRKVLLVFALACLIFGTTFLAIKIGIEAGAPPFLFAGLRFTVAGATLALLLLASGRTSFTALVALAPKAVLLSSLYIVANFGATFWAEQYIGSGAAAQINASGPIASALLASLFLGKKLKPVQILGVLGGFAGVGLIVRGSGPDIAGQNRESLIASIVMLAGTVSFSGASVLYKRIFDDSTDSFAVNALNMLAGGIGLLILSALVERRPLPVSAGTIIPLAYLVVAGSLVGHSANLWLVKKAGPLFASSWSYVSPIIATAVGAVALGEAVKLGAITGTLLTLLCVGFLSRAELATQREPQAISPLAGGRN